MDLRYLHKGLLLGQPYNIAFGTNYDTMTDDRTGFLNFIGPAGGICGTTDQCGVKGALKRDETDTARNFDRYIQGEWAPHERLNFVAGVRHSLVKIKSDDHFISVGNGNDSGKTEFEKTTPVAGIVFKVTPELNVYANAGKGFETPTLIELAYRPDGNPGLNFDLRQSTSNNYEIGAKAFLRANTRANLAVFRIDTNHEIVTATNSGGRTTYQNAGGTQRTGLEFSMDSELGNGLTTYAAYSYINAKYTAPFQSCGTLPSPCGPGKANLPITITSDNRIPGIYRQTAYAEIAWKYVPAEFTTALEARANSKVYVDDTNQNTAPGYAVMNWRGGFAQTLGSWKFGEFVRVENLFDRHYISSVKINDANKQFYEPAANRNWLIGLNASYQF